MNLERLDWILSKAMSSHDLTEWEQGFIDGTVEQRDRLGDDIRISERQEEVLERIARERID